MNKSRKNLIAIVTGASRPKGIGAAICRELANNGMNIFFTHLSRYDQATGYEDADQNFAEDFKRELRNLGVSAASVELDLSDQDAPKRLLNEVAKMPGKLSVLVNNATFCVEVGHEEVTTELFDRHCAVNVRGTCMLTVEFAKQLKKEQSSGRIVNFVSGQDKSPQPGNIAYITTKGAISAFTKSLATELASSHITVNAIDPGPTDSGCMDKETQDFLRPKFPTGRIGTPEDAARLVGFLVSDSARWITGQIIHSDGGFED
ncbi:SDR family oxidoreductase [Pseudalkalibacillus hwajinpoensis]|uniref:SDR family oxidoreductase n=1 Tax=Guptibacillus hwajinpoensis TaxID=208199 RepID=A0A4U1MNY9_9BACL|nr:SDR family oxidoreductase [Pseudalkalibacillus hwajinpoensis]TKD72372.1 SDR family oxidoreductase [Pseudalkalibacillus hwajinpoensis]